MKPASLYILLICLMSANISCSKLPCECDFIPADFIEFKVLNHQGQNLLFGSFALYLTDSIQILKEKNNLTVNGVCKKRRDGRLRSSYIVLEVLNICTQDVILVDFGLNIAGYSLLNSDNYASTV